MPRGNAPSGTSWRYSAAGDSGAGPWPHGSDGVCGLRGVAGSTPALWAGLDACALRRARGLASRAGLDPFAPAPEICGVVLRIGPSPLPRTSLRTFRRHCASAHPTGLDAWRGGTVQIRRLGSTALPFFLVLASASCNRDLTGPLSTGTWGGTGIALTVADKGASVELDCAHGTIDGDLVANASGAFDIAGTYTYEHGGPIREDEPPDQHPARYLGELTSPDDLTLSIRVTDRDQTIGPFSLRRGAQPRVFKCL